MVEGLPPLVGVVDTDIFVAAVGEERRAGVKNFGATIVNGVLQGECLEGFRSIIGNHI